MLITTMLAYLVARESWGVSRTVAGSLAVFFLTIEGAFFGANLTKIAHGGWFPLSIGAIVFVGLVHLEAGSRVALCAAHASACIRSIGS